MPCVSQVMGTMRRPSCMAANLWIMFYSLNLAHKCCHSFVFPLCYLWLESLWNVTVIKTWNTWQLKCVDYHNHFHGVFMGNGCLHWCARYKHTTVCRPLWHSSTSLSFFRTIKCVYYSSNCRSIYLPWGLDMVEKDADFTLNASANNVFVIQYMAFTSMKS